MKDGLGQEINVGSTVVWVGGKTQYGGVRKYKVIRISAKKVRIEGLIGPQTSLGKIKEVSVYPETVVVVDKLLQPE